jgi:hypothetical protein
MKLSISGYQESGEGFKVNADIQKGEATNTYHNHPAFTAQSVAMEYSFDESDEIPF